MVSTWIEGDARLLPHRLTPRSRHVPPPHTRRGAVAVAGVTAIVAAGLGAALALSACTAPNPTTTPHPTGSSPTRPARRRATSTRSRWVSYAEPYSLDYAYAFDYSDNQVLANVCESLLRLNPDYTLSPGLAESFEHPTPTTWVYTIRDGVTFHDGTPLTAADVVASMNRHLDPAVGLVVVLGLPERRVDRADRRPRRSPSRRHRPTRSSTSRMGGSAGVIESAATLAEKGADYGNSTGGVNCTGPFSFGEWKSGESHHARRATTATGTTTLARQVRRGRSSSS